MGSDWILSVFAGEWCVCIYIRAMYQSVAILTAARVVDIAARYLRLMHVMIVKPIDHFNVITQKVQMVPETKYHCNVWLEEHPKGLMIGLTKRPSFI